MHGCCASLVPGLAVTIRPGSWQHGGAQLLLAEAFITAAGKPEPLPAGQDAADAAAAGLALAEMLDGSAPLGSSMRCVPQEPFNLVAAMALWAGLRIDPAELHAEVLVVAACPEPRAPALMSATRKRMDALAHLGTGRIVGA